MNEILAGLLPELGKPVTATVNGAIPLELAFGRIDGETNLRQLDDSRLFRETPASRHQLHHIARLETVLTGKPLALTDVILEYQHSILTAKRTGSSRRENVSRVPNSQRLENLVPP